LKQFSILILLTGFTFFVPGCYLIKQAVYDNPRTEVVSPPPMPLTEVKIYYSGGIIQGWLNKTAPSTDATPVVLYLHGNNDNLQTMLRKKVFAEFAKMKVNLLAVDYPGYGNSSGIPNEKNVVESTDSALAFIKKEFPSNPKFLIGYSIGAAVTVQTALKYQSDIKGVALISPWVSIDSMVALHYPRWMVTMFLKDKYAIIPAAENLEVPTLVLHGEMDRSVPFTQGKKVADALPQLKKWQILKGTDQNNLFLNQKLWESLSAFIRYPEIDWNQRE
jgi:pimeloyl-ACP methyl ester carboxylesterase